MAAKKLTISGKQPAKGIRMRKDSKWTIAATDGKGRTFVATLITTINAGSKRLAIFSVPKRVKAR